MIRKNTNRMGRVNEELKKEISQVIDYELKNSDISGIISVTRVNCTPDLRYAKVYVSFLNSKNVQKSLQGLKKATGFIRSRVANTVNLRITPEIVFELDDSSLVGSRIDNILKEIKEQDDAIKNKNKNND
jgi:ribosome-binding factor A